MSLLSDSLLRKFRGYIVSLLKLKKYTHTILNEYIVIDNINPGETPVSCHSIWHIDLSPIYAARVTSDGMGEATFVPDKLLILNITYTICGPTLSTQWKGNVYYNSYKLDPIQDNLYRVDSDISLPVEGVISFIFTNLKSTPEPSSPKQEPLLIRIRPV